MRPVTIGCVLGLASMASARAVPLVHNPAGIELGAHRRSSWCAMAVGAVGTGPTGATIGAIGSGVTAFPTKVVMVTTGGALAGTLLIQIGVQHGLGGVGVINRSDGNAERRRPQY
jgi:hypothetical protein